ncbi:MAG: acyltransferase [Ramlibacter sp.]|nr:acyltransferase [Ramlibacter sp.]
MAQVHFPGIDALRGLAVLAVIAYHADHGWLSGGFVGVDVFFVISGYVISHAMVGVRDLGPGSFLASFYARRVGRIVPALLVCLLVTSLLEAMLVPASWEGRFNRDTVALAYWGFANLALMRSGEDYFSAGPEFNPFTHTWSLGVEEQFYLLFPILFFLWLSRGRWPDWRGRVAAAFLAVLAFASLACSVYLSLADPKVAYFSVLSRVWELAAGALLFQHHQTRRIVADSRFKDAQLLLCMGGLAASFAFSDSSRFPIPWALLPVACTLGLLDAVVSGAARRTWLEQRALVATGRWSYSLYLWHWPVFVLFRWTCGLDTLPLKLTALAMSFALALASYRWVELPLRRRLSAGRPVRVILAGVASVALASLLGLGIHEARHVLSMSVTTDCEVWNPYRTYAREGNSGPCKIVREQQGLTAQGRRSTYVPGECEVSGAVPRIFVTGNSHSVAYTRMVTRLVAEHGYTVHMYYEFGCSFAHLTGSGSRVGQNCQPFFDGMLQDIQLKARPGDILFLPSLRTPRNYDEDLRSSVRQPAMTAALEEAQRSLEPMARAGARVVFEAPKPIFLSQAHRCSDWFNRMNPACSKGFEVGREKFLRFRAPVLEQMDRVKANLPNVSVWDPAPHLCPLDPCHAFQDGKPLFHDHDHVTAYANDVLYPSFRDHLRALWVLKPTAARPVQQAQ